MDVTTMSYSPARGWSLPCFPRLDSPRTLVLVFAGPAFRDAHGPLAELGRAYPSSVVVGCSTAGEIHGTLVEDDSLSVAVVRFDRTALRLVATAVAKSAPSSEPGAVIGKALAGFGLRAVLVFSDGLAVNGTALLDGIHGVLPPDVVVTGGLAGDGSRFERTWVLVEGKPRANHVVGVGLYGEHLGVSHGSRGGWDAFGPERVVTRSEGNVLHELDGEPALALYKQYLGDRAAGLPATALLFPLALRSDTVGQARVRTVLSVDETEQTMTFAGDIPHMSTVQLMRANLDRLVDGAALASQDAFADASGDVFTLAVSCVGRRLVLGERVEEEIEAVFESMPAGSKLVGFYSYGEIAPFAPGQRAVLHNQTMTLTRLWET